MYGSWKESCANEYVCSKIPLMPPGWGVFGIVFITIPVLTARGFFCFSSRAPALVTAVSFTFAGHAHCVKRPR